MPNGFHFSIDQKVHVQCLSIIVPGKVKKRKFTEDANGIERSYVVAMDFNGDTVSPSESQLIDAQSFPIGHQFK